MSEGGRRLGQHKCMELEKRSTALCYHARLMLWTTSILYCKCAALHHVRTAHPIHSLVTIGPLSSSTLSDKGLSDEATCALASAREGVAPRGYLVATRASSLVNQTVLGCAWAQPWKNGLVMCIQPHLCAWPYPISARGECPGNAEDTAGHSSS